MTTSSGGFYELLGVDTDADAGTIREAYRERVKETHPDVSDAADATARFRRIKRAHEVLTDPVERSRYDRLGHEAYLAGESPLARSPEAPGTDATRDTETGSRSHRRERSGKETRHGSRHRSASATATGAHRRDRTRRGATATGAGSSRTRTAGTAGGTTSATGPTSSPGPGRSHSMDETDVGPLRWGTARWIRFAGALIDAWQTRLTPAAGAITMGVFVVYPVLLVSSVTPMFPPAVNLSVGVCTLLLVGYLVARPLIGVPVFGGWTLIFPIALTVGGLGVLSVTGVLVVAFTLLPLCICVALLAAGMPV